MLSVKVVNRHENGDLCGVVLHFLAEAVRQAGESPVRHSDREVVALDVRRADVIGIRVASNGLDLAADALSRAVTALAFSVDLAVTLHQLRIVDVLTECSLNRLAVELQAVRG